uniref:Uncharacterized protein n=1 Tax=Anopheles melas TaxID=34690 RepID=A0A182UCW8_9DIPT
MRCPSLDGLGSLERKARRKAILELLNNEATVNDPRFLMDGTDFDVRFFNTIAIQPSEQLGVRDTLTTQKVLETLSKRSSRCQMRNLLDGKCYSNVTLSCCKAVEEPCCDPHYP